MSQTPRFFTTLAAVATLSLAFSGAACGDAAAPSNASAPQQTPARGATNTAPASTVSEGKPGGAAPGVTPTAPASTPAAPARAGAAGAEGTAAADFALVNSAGETQHLSDFKGKVVVLDFWATWCPPCRQEIPGFVAMKTKYSSRNVEVIGISLDDGWEPVRPFMTQYGINYPVLLGNQNVVSAYGSFDGIPTTFVIDKDGVIRAKHTGYAPQAAFEHIVEGLL